MPRECSRGSRTLSWSITSSICVKSKTCFGMESVDVVEYHDGMYYACSKIYDPKYPVFGFKNRILYLFFGNQIIESNPIFESDTGSGLDYWQNRISRFLIFLLFINFYFKNIYIYFLENFCLSC